MAFLLNRYINGNVFNIYAPKPPGQPRHLFFSEYIEGSSYNKALEIYNGTGATVDLAVGGYSILMSFNGGTSTYTINLTGSVADGDVYVVAPTNATDPTILAQADQFQGTSWFNGDDAVVLMKGADVLDVIGQVGFDPGTEWGSDLISTADNTLRRMGTICAGDPDGSNVFDPSFEWDGYNNNTFDGLGAHTALCGPSEPKLNEFSASTTGTDVEWVEVFGSADTDLSAYTVLEIEGDTTGAGVVDEVIAVGATDSAGFYLANLAANALENGTITLLLVKDFTGTFGQDLDTNNDGVFDDTPWSLIADVVAVNDGGSGDFTYGTPSLGPNYDGLSSYAPGGASRYPDGFDTEMPTDWVRNDFELAGIPGYPGTISLGEAYNTPGAPNAIYVPPPEACGDPYTPIYAVQGNGLTSPLEGMEVALEGIVVGDFQNNDQPDSGDLNGFNIQDMTGDGDAATSDGVFIYASSAADILVGDHVRVRGTVSEYYGMTEVTASQVWVCSSGNSVAPTPLSLPVATLDDFESYEGMLVTLPQELVIAEYYNYDRYGEIVLGLPFEGQSRLFTPTSVVEPGDPAIELAYQNSLRRITLDDGFSSQNPAILHRTVSPSASITCSAG
jgi:predicted extracellular nuclease